jgi:hypothetical protein
MRQPYRRCSATQWRKERKDARQAHRIQRIPLPLGKPSGTG